MSRRRLLGVGGLLFGGGSRAGPRVELPDVRDPQRRLADRLSPQHPVGNGLLAEQFPTERRGFAISAHIAGGNVGTVVVALIGAPLIAAVGWRGASIFFGIPAVIIAVLILMFVRERGTDARRLAPAGPSAPRFATSLPTATCAGCT